MGWLLLVAQFAPLGAPERMQAKRIALIARDLGAQAVPIEGTLAPSALKRIVHLGDSQIASDYMTELVRRRLMLRFGSGGRGFLLIDRPSKIAGRITRAGVASPGWRLEKLPQAHLSDHVFSFTGVNFIADAPQSVSFELGDARTADIFYQPTRGIIEAQVDDSEPVRLSLKEATAPLPVKGKTLTLKTRGPARLYGVALENGLDGAVYDAIGVPGVGFNAWLDADVDVFAAHLQRRAPTLVILQLAGAEVYRLTRGWTTPERIKDDARAMVNRVKRAVPKAACLLIGPFARASAETLKARHETLRVNQALREVAVETGCAFWSALDAMGGVDAALKWRKLKAMNQDYVHPQQAGADVLGQLLEHALTQDAPAPPLLLGLENAAFLQRSFKKLHALEDTEAGRFAIVQLGASHTAWQEFTDAARALLTDRFGDRGRGHVDVIAPQTPWRRLGFVRKLSGAWQTFNALRGDAGPFGLTGMRLVGDDGATLSLAFPPMQATLDVFGETEVRVEGKRVSTPYALRGHERSLSLHGGTVYGVAFEKQVPGLLYDSLGLGGSTAVLADGYDKPVFTQLLAQRKADLYVLFYGTNEAGAPFDAAAYRAHYKSLLATLRSASADAECIIMSNTDRAKAPAQADVAATLRSIAAEEQCAFWSSIDQMGGAGSIDRWARLQVPLAKHDRVHLTETGYAGLAAAFVDDFIEAYERDAYKPPP